MVHVFSNLEDMEDGHQPFCDMTFEIVKSVYDIQASVWRLDFRADATPCEPVGFSAEIPLKGWREQVDGEGEEAFHSFWGQIKLRSLGHDSDRMLALMADYYGNSPPQSSSTWLSKLRRSKDALLSIGWTFSNSIECLAVGIASNPAAIADGPVHMKLFFDDGVENGRYAEVFFNVDLPKGFCALNEKDESYRADLVHWLSRPGDVNAAPFGDSR